MSARFSFSYRSCCCLFLVIVVSLFHLCQSNKSFDDDVLCLGSERQALLQFKYGLIDEAGRLASWDDGEERDCCKWVGIGCNNFTGHVHHIHLPALNGHCKSNGDYKTYSEYKEASKQRLRGKFSSSLLHLKQLRHLDLSCNDFVGIQVPKFIGSLSNLRYLNLSMSNFSGMIPPQLGNLSELHVLSLGSFHGPYETTSMMNNMEWLSSLHLLQHLDLSGVDLSKSVNWLQVINTIPSLVQLHLSDCELSDIHSHVASVNLTSLSILDLSSNNFSSPLPPWIFSITSLVSMDLTSCYFHVPTPNSILFHNLTSLESLHVASNNFMNSSLVLRDLSSVGSNLIFIDMGNCGVSSSVLESLHNLTSLRSLDLSYNQLTKAIPKSLGCNFCNLRDLDLSVNDFGNISLTSLVVESVFKCKSPHLESLYVTRSKISGRIPDSIGRLSFLRSLDLRWNLISGAIPSSIGQLALLKKLDLSNNQLNGGLPYSIGRLSSLEVMDLSINRLNGGLPYSIGRLSSLVVMDLSMNRLNGVLPDSLGGLSLLKELDLSDNRIAGTIPDSIGRLSSLEALYLSDNQLNGGLPHSIGQLSSLQELLLWNNQLNGVVTEAHFSKLVNLKYLIGGGNKLTLRTIIDNWIPPFQLWTLDLNSWVLGPQFPLWLQSQKDLEMLDISNTQISSPMPSESFWRSLPNLYYLDMSHNHIQGTLVDIPTTTLQLDLSNNFFEGTLHDLLCSDGEKQTQLLYLDNNHLSGVIPECWDKWPLLRALDLENNNLSGGIPTTLGFSSQLQSLSLRGNKLSGRLSVSLKSLTDLEILKLGRNELEGSIPSWFGTQLSQLRLLNLRSNKLEENIPHKLCNLKHLQILDLAHNKLSGNIPKCFNNFSVLTGNETISYAVISTPVNFSGVSSDSLVMKGREDTYSSILGLVKLLDLSSNNLVGHIPSELTALRELKTLNLSGNRLTGRIPDKIGEMKAIETLDLSLNMLSGELPVSLSQLNFLSSFNVSSNNLTGRVPTSTQLQSLSKSCFFGNQLCGPPVTESCVRVKVPKKTDSEQQEDDGTDWGLILSSVLGFVSGFWIILAPLIVSRSWRIAYYVFLSEQRYMVYDGMHRYCFNVFCK